jgi:Tfp pilus assembly protein PilO
LPNQKNEIMKKLFAVLFAGALLASCGGSSYTTDKEEALEMKKSQTEDMKSYYESALEIETNFYASQKEILADFGGKESTLMNKAKTKDEKALDALADLRNLELGKRRDMDALSRKYEDSHRALSQSIRDINQLNDSKDLKEWSKAIEAEEKIQSDLADKHYKAVDKLRKD